MEIGDCVLVMKGHTGAVTSIALAKSTLITGSIDASVRVWSMQSGACLHTLTGHGGGVNDVAITPDASMAVSVCSSGTGRIWDLARGGTGALLSGWDAGAQPAAPSGWL